MTLSEMKIEAAHLRSQRQLTQADVDKRAGAHGAKARYDYTRPSTPHPAAH